MRTPGISHREPGILPHVRTPGISHREPGIPPHVRTPGISHREPGIPPHVRTPGISLREPGIHLPIPDPAPLVPPGEINPGFGLPEILEDLHETGIPGLLGTGSPDSAAHTLDKMTTCAR